MVDDEINDDADVALVSFVQQVLEIIHRPVFGIDTVIIDDVVSMIRRGGVDRHEPDGIDAERFEIIQFLGDAVEIADAVVVAVVERADENFVEDRGAPPVSRLSLRGGGGLGCGNRRRRGRCA